MWFLFFFFQSWSKISSGHALNAYILKHLENNENSVEDILNNLNRPEITFYHFSSMRVRELGEETPWIYLLTPEIPHLGIQHGPQCEPGFSLQQTTCLLSPLHPTQSPGSAGSHLSDDALDQLVHGEGDVGVDGEHLAQGILILRRVHVPIQEVAHHVQEGRVIILNIDVHCSRREGERWAHCPQER